METTNASDTGERRSGIILLMAFAAVYVLWGSTYIALHFALESIPPFLISAFRFLTAGTIMLLIARYSRADWPSWRECKNAIITGFLLLVLGNGGVVWAQQFIPSGITALIVTIEPIWVVLLIWLKDQNKKPGLVIWTGIFMGLLGMIILVGPSNLEGIEMINIWGLIALIISSISWAIGSLYALNVKLPSSASMSTGLQMLSASFFMLILSLAHGDWITFDPVDITTNSWLGFFYLVVFGSLVGFTSYSYIVKHASPTSVSTYAYVNPVIAVFLGWWLGNERVSSQTLLAAALLVTAVILIVMKPSFKILQKKEI